MTNKEIASSFKVLGNLMELHDENPFKFRSYNNAYITLRKVEEPLSSMTIEELMSIGGIGKNIAYKIVELSETGTLELLEKFKNITPVGIQEILTIRGLGPKKIKILWHELEIESPSDLLYACNENRLVSVKGFGIKTQEGVKKTLEFFMDNQGKHLYAHVIDHALNLLELLLENWPDEQFEIVGELGRKMQEVEGIEVLSTINFIEETDNIPFEENEEGQILFENIPVFMAESSHESFGSDLFLSNSSQAFIEASGFDTFDVYESEDEIFEDLEAEYVYPEYRETAKAWDQSTTGQLPELIKLEDIKGVVHNHSKYSDGLHTVDQMTQRCIERGYKYFVICDHSKSAFYAQGMTIEEVLMQWEEIDQLNVKYPDFRIFKGIESDILNDGSLDYPEEILKGFEVIVASIHSNLKMPEEKANARLIKAIENPYTNILGHPTGRLLLGRAGYPIDHKKIIDACSQNNVTIELNANPQRLDMDWRWIDYAISKEVLISINPDAHSMGQIDYIKYGVYSARKGGLTKEMCLNAMDLPAFEMWVNS